MTEQWAMSALLSEILLAVARATERGVPMKEITELLRRTVGELEQQQ